MKPVKVLIVEDDKDMADSCKRLFKRSGIATAVAYTGLEAIEIIKKKGKIDIVLTDLKMPGMDGIELLKKIKKLKPSIEVIVMTGYGTIHNAVNAIKLGASDYITKPFNKDELINAVNKIVEKDCLKNQVLSLRSELEQKYNFKNLIGKSKEMTIVYDAIKAAARNDSSILIIGESGTGKELVARAIHYNSAKAKGPFVPVNCGALPKELIESEFFGHKKGAFTTADSTTDGLFKTAEGGTIFLDEIAEMYKDTQVKLLRVLQDKMVRPVGGTKEFPVDVKVICATNRSLSELMEKELIRKDLYYRISVITINTPPLREHTEDIPLFVNHYIKKFNDHFNMNINGIERKALDLLMDYPWPGNVRELENLLEGLFATDIKERITSKDLPKRFKERFKEKPRNLHSSKTNDTAGHAEDDVTTTLSLKETERNLIERTLKACKGNKSKAAKKLGISRTRLYKELDRFGLKELE
ncbi:MAG: sigma-54-dependent transcriptional regulator [Candidatus Anammoxibacter sp.]